jgi:hypothetical protein
MTAESFIPPAVPEVPRAGIVGPSGRRLNSQAKTNDRPKPRQPKRAAKDQDESAADAQQQHGGDEEHFVDYYA